MKALRKIELEEPLSRACFCPFCKARNLQEFWMLVSTKQFADFADLGGNLSETPRVWSELVLEEGDEIGIRDSADVDWDLYIVAELDEYHGTVQLLHDNSHTSTVWLRTLQRAWDSELLIIGRRASGY